MSIKNVTLSQLMFGAYDLRTDDQVSGLTVAAHIFLDRYKFFLTHSRV